MCTISVVGIGYVGISNALVLAKKNKVFAVDIDPEKVKLLNERRSPVRDKDIERYLAAEKLDLTATDDAETAYGHSDFVVVAVPTLIPRRRKGSLATLRGQIPMPLS